MKHASTPLSLRCTAATAMEIDERDFCATYDPMANYWTAAWKWAENKEPTVKQVRAMVSAGVMSATECWCPFIEELHLTCGPKVLLELSLSNESFTPRKSVDGEGGVGLLSGREELAAQAGSFHSVGCPSCDMYINRALFTFTALHCTESHVMMSVRGVGSVSPLMSNKFDTVSVHLLYLRHHSQEQISHPGDISCEGALVLTTVGSRHLYGVTTIEHCSRTPCGDP
ncbi:hypothetical protein E2C01_004835 [Portunus trituberculatus]|uniref:Uncharacterized protein n=1 Tax=Portunus trituberculatus TaxID=210409 RepID=A0A5B7CQQ6_PORTR|nr:hypothetical protein [Portunus trituberculatus]